MGLLSPTATSRRWIGRAGWVATALVLGGLLAGAAPARAGGDGDFEDGFEDELGRLAAREVVRFGKFVLSGGYAPYYYAQWGAVYPVPAHPSYQHPVYRRHPRHAKRARRPYRPTAAHPAPPHAAQPCQGHVPEAVAPYGERIVYERYERVINGPSYGVGDRLYEERARY